MELTLTRQAGTQILVTCDERSSHTFDLLTLVPGEKGPPQPLDDPVAYGKAVYQALFPPETAARRELDAMPERILLVTTDDTIDATPWEYAHGPDGFLVQECQFVRGLPAEQRILPPTLDSGLHIVAVPSNPLDKDTPALDIDGEWMRLKELLEQVPFVLTLERTRPPTIEQARALLANQRQRVVHFMGHGGQQKDLGAFLSFEKDNGDLDLVMARQFVQRVRGTVFLVTLNACVSATPGPTPFSNLAASLVMQKVPYALGMRLSITDEDARAFSRTFYTELARGSPVEEALLQARLTLANRSHPWAVGVPVLYTSLAQPPAGFASQAGTPTINEHQPHMEVSACPRAEGAFQGRIDELKALGTDLTGDGRPRLITIHGGGGQGKTALAREAVERFAYAWPGGVWARSLENLPDRALVVADLAAFLGLPTQEGADPNEVERRVLRQLPSRRTLLVLDNAETLIDAVERNDAAALHLVEFIKHLPGPSVSLLMTSRVQFGWSGEVSYELGGLSPEEGADLFRQSAPHRTNDIAPAQAQELSRKVEGHPLGILLLGKAFNAIAISLRAFLQECDAHLAQAEDKFVGPEHRHRTLHACIEMSVRYLDANLRTLLSGLWVFHAPFLAEAAVALFDPEHEDSEANPSPIRDLLHTLWQRGLLAREETTVRDGTVQFYHLLPTTRPYVEHYLKQTYEREKLLAQFGIVYSDLAGELFLELNSSATAVTIAQQTREDLVRGVEYIVGVPQGYYLLDCGWILYRLGDPRHGLALLERALEIAQGKDQLLEFYVRNNMGLVYHATGQRQEALKLFQQALLTSREIGNRAGEGATLNNMGLVYNATGQPQEALKLCEQALPINREVGDRAGEATTLINMANVYQATGQPQKALKLYEQALPISHEVGDRAGEATTLSNMAGVYHATGQPQEALKLHQQALSISREVGDRAGEAATLNSMAGVYHTTGQPQEALKLYQQALSISREVGDRAEEAATLNNMAGVYRASGQPQEALKLHQQALPIRREVGDRAGEAITLNNMGLVYYTTGQRQEALKLYQQALSISREAGDRAQEATTLNNMGLVYQDTDQRQEALKLYQQALSISREAGDRAGEATTLNNMGLVYQATGQMQKALKFYQQALPISHEVGDRDGEATTLNNMAGVYQDIGRPREALKLFEQALPISRAVGDRAGEATTLANIADVLYQGLNRSQEAIAMMEQAIAVLVETGLSQDSAGQTRDDMQRYLDMMRQGLSPDQANSGLATMPSDQLEVIVSNTVEVMMTMPERRDEWYEVMVKALENAQQRGTDWHIEVEFYTAVLAILDGKAAALPGDHIYALALAQIQEGIAAGELEDDETLQDDDLPFDAELIYRSIDAFLGGPPEKMAHAQYLTAMSAQTTDEGLKVLLQVIQLGLFGSDLSQLGEDLSGVYKEAWEDIVVGVETGVDPRLFDMIVQNTLEVLGPAADQVGKWRDELVQIKSEAVEEDAQELVALLEAVIRLLDAGGNPAGLGTNLIGMYEITWQAIVVNLSSA